LTSLIYAGCPCKTWKRTPHVSIPMNARWACALRAPRLSGGSTTFQFYVKLSNPSGLVRRPIPLYAGSIQRRCDIGLWRASAARGIATDSRSPATRLKNLLYGTSVALFLFFGYYAVTDVRFSPHKWLCVPVLRYVYNDAEEAHRAATKALKTLYQLGIHPRERGNPDAAGDLQVQVITVPLLSL
jgi:hypothetical protein